VIASLAYASEFSVLYIDLMDDNHFESGPLLEARSDALMFFDILYALLFIGGFGAMRILFLNQPNRRLLSC
jgi:hypothetical protein